MFNSQYYTCEQIDERLLQGYLDDYNQVNGTNIDKSEFLTTLFNYLNQGLRFSDIVQLVGSATNKVMSQKATTDALGTKVTIPSFKITESDVYNRLIKELYLFDVDDSKYYFVYQCRYSYPAGEAERVQFYIFWNNTDTPPTKDNAHFVCNYDVAASGHTNGLVPLRNGQTVVGYAVVEFTAEDNNNVFDQRVNKDVVSKLDFSPYIKSYLIEQILSPIPSNLSEVNLKLSDIEGADDILPPQSEWIMDKVVEPDGEVRAGQYTTGFATTPLIEISPNDVIRLAFVRGYYLLGAVIYDENEDVIEVVYGTPDGSYPHENLDIPYTFVVRPGARYMRYNIVSNSLFPYSSQSIIRIKNGSISYIYRYFKNLIDNLDRVFDGGTANTVYGGSRSIDCGGANSVIS